LFKMLKNFSLKCFIKNSSMSLKQYYFHLWNLQKSYNGLENYFVNGDCIVHRREY
jgi:hypothetical protein